jgi:hypothetical protein
MVMQSFLKTGLRKLIPIATNILIIGLCFIILIPAGNAVSRCKTISGSEVCIAEIKRSAKNYWEYRLKLQVKNQGKVTLTYDCRDRRLIKSSPKNQAFDYQLIGHWICDLF